MNLFDKLVTEALQNQPDLSPLRIVVEKELLHHDILRTLSDNNFLTKLTFIGGTCLRCCYGGIRLSEDLDFTGGDDFTKASLATMGDILVQNLHEKYGLTIKVTEPTKDKQNVDTWKIKIETRPEQNNFPSQRINIDICAIPSYEKTPMLLLNPYGVDMGTSGLIIQAQSREEIYADKLIAFAFRANRIKYRDLWDIIWLHERTTKPRIELIPIKVQNRNMTMRSFFDAYNQRTNSLQNNNKMALEFKQEMQRFLPINKSLDQDKLWKFITYLMEDLGKQIEKQA